MVGPASLQGLHHDSTKHWPSLGTRWPATSRLIQTLQHINVAVQQNGVFIPPVQAPPTHQYIYPHKKLPSHNDPSQFLSKPRSATPLSTLSSVSAAVSTLMPSYSVLHPCHLLLVCHVVHYCPHQDTGNHILVCFQQLFIDTQGEVASRFWFSSFQPTKGMSNQQKERPTNKNNVQNW